MLKYNENRIVRLKHKYPLKWVALFKFGLKMMNLISRSFSVSRLWFLSSSFVLSSSLGEMVSNHHDYLYFLPSSVELPLVVVTVYMYIFLYNPVRIDASTCSYSCFLSFFHNILLYSNTHQENNKQHSKHPVFHNPSDNASLNIDLVYIWSKQG